VLAKVNRAELEEALLAGADAVDGADARGAAGDASLGSGLGRAGSRGGLLGEGVGGDGSEVEETLERLAESGGHCDCVVVMVIYECGWYGGSSRRRARDRSEDCVM
jgi:hypothetical protein